MPDPMRPEEDDNAWVDEWEGTFGETGSLEEERPRRSWWRFLAAWLLCAAVLGVIGFGGITLGERFHNPASRIPDAPLDGVGSGLYGVSQPLLSEFVSIENLVPAGASLTLEGRVERMEFPRTVADRLFGKRKEDALVFTAETPSGSSLRVLALRENGEVTVFAVRRAPRRDDESLEGLYVGVAPGPTRDALEALMPEVNAAAKREHSAGEVTIFGSFDRGDRDVLRARIEENTVLRHLAASLEAEGGNVSVASPAFVVLDTPSDRTINAIYQPTGNLVLQPLWGENQTSSLAHELVHAYFDEVAASEGVAQREAQAYLEANQPHLYGDIVGDLYERLDRLGQAEEAIAFIVGAMAARQPTTVAPARVLQNQNLISASAGLLKSDVEFLIGMGLLPACMDPAALGHTNERIDFAYYDKVDAAC